MCRRPSKPAPRNPLEEVGDVAGELHHFEASLHLAESIIDGLPMLRGEDLGEIHLSRCDQLAEGEHDVLTLGQRGEPPRLERCPSRLHRAIHVGSRAQNHLAGLFPRGRVVHRPDPRLAPPVSCPSIQCWICLMGRIYTGGDHTTETRESHRNGWASRFLGKSAPWSNSRKKPLAPAR